MTSGTTNGTATAQPVQLIYRFADVPSTDINELKSFGARVYVHDPIADPAEAMHEYGVKLLPWDELPRADAIVAAVAHNKYRQLTLEDLSRKIVKGGCFIDVKAGFSEAELTAAGLKVWRQ